jgi:hypothetical protein
MTLDDLLQRWSEARRLTDAQSEFIRASVVRSVAPTESASALDFNWFWTLMQPVMDLIPSALQEPVFSSPVQPYLRL